MAIKTDKVIVYHIPKTGGTWVKKAMKAAGLRYRPTRNVSKSHPWNLKKAHATPDIVVPRAREGRFAFTFVRRPAGWYRSYWCFRMRKGARRDEKFPADGLWSDSFDQFVSNVLDTFPGGFVTALYQSYVGESGQDLDFVGRQERLADDLVRALRMAGEDFNEDALRATPRANVSKARWMRQTGFSNATKRKLKEDERWVWETFYA